MSEPTGRAERIRQRALDSKSADQLDPLPAFKVRLARSGGEYIIPTDRSIVETLAEYGIHIETSCEQGACGSCLTGLLAGEPDHRDVFLTDAEKQAGDKMLPCVSRSKSEVLVLDL
jgi:vanillate O-demethylase ferredoxin subunit